MKESISRIREVACFAGVFLVVHFLIGILFEPGASSGGPEEAYRWSSVLDQLFRSLVTVAVATPVYLFLMSVYRKRKAKKDRDSGRERR